VDETADDTLIGTMIKAATRLVENYLDRKLITQDWMVTFDTWPIAAIKDDWWDGVREVAINAVYPQKRSIEFPIGPMQSVQSFKTYDNENTAIVEDLNNYVVDTKGPYGRISLTRSGVWPTTYLRSMNAIEFVIRVGYGASGSSVPDDIILGLKMAVANLYENRGDIKGEFLSTNCKMLLDPYRRIKVSRGN
jgi:hypothetical protein